MSQSFDRVRTWRRGGAKAVTANVRFACLLTLDVRQFGLVFGFLDTFGRGHVELEAMQDVEV